MSLSKLKRNEIIEALIIELGIGEYTHSFSVDRFAKEQGISRQSVYRYLNALANDGIIIKGRMKTDGSTKYDFQIGDNVYKFGYPVDGLAEDTVWNQDIRPVLHGVPEIALRICNYAFCELLNNVIDHSEGTKVEIELSVNASRISFCIRDDGVGIFAKIAAAMNLAEKRYAVLELVKGKLTTAPETHSGEGIFFSAKAADVFSIHSDGLVYSTSVFDKFGYESFCPDDSPAQGGTAIRFDVFRHHKTPISELFDSYTKAPEDYGFSKTVVPVRLLEFGDDSPSFVSRSQAKRLLVRFERFEYIELDFAGIEEIGQGFADEVFRVFCSRHPSVEIVPTNCSPQVEKMINHVTHAG